MIWVDVDPQWEVWTSTRKNTKIYSINFNIICYMPLFESSFLPFIWVIIFFFFLIFCPSPPRLALDCLWSYQAFLFMTFHFERRLLRYASLFRCPPGQLLVLLDFSFASFSSWTKNSGAPPTIQSCPSKLNAVIVGKWLFLMQRRLWNHQEPLKNYLKEIWPFYNLSW